jgi:predicted house-cleaning noncanonical NTP pyrophosphatase (MazG superfamily)
MCFNQTTGALISEKHLTLYLRYETTYSRAFNNSLNQLLKLRAEKRKAELGFEAQQRKQQAELRAAEKHQMKKDAHYWEVIRKDAQARHEMGRNLNQKRAAEKQNPNFETHLEAEFKKYNVGKASFNVAAAA